MAKYQDQKKYDFAQSTSIIYRNKLRIPLDKDGPLLLENSLVNVFVEGNLSKLQETLSTHTEYFRDNPDKVLNAFLHYSLERECHKRPLFNELLDFIRLEKIEVKDTLFECANYPLHFQTTEIFFDFYGSGLWNIQELNKKLKAHVSQQSDHFSSQIQSHFVEKILVEIEKRTLEASLPMSLDKEKVPHTFKI